ncbi:MAG: histidine kinase [Eubacterium sp.]|nr:histidine kinase [Eubacterium sp.]
MRLRKKLVLMYVLMVVPFLSIIIALLVGLKSVSNSYDVIVGNVTEANEYNIVLEESVDASVYQMVVQSLTTSEVGEIEGMENPNTLIAEAKDTFEDLKESASSSDAISRADSIINLLTSLKECVDEIDGTVKVTGSYEENVSRLDTDVRVITDLIQEKITEYIYFETDSMNAIRANLNNWLHAIINSAVVFVFLFLAITIYLFYSAARSITKPVESLSEAADRVGQGDFSVRATEEGSEEIALFARAFNLMTGQLEELIENIKMEQINSRNLELKLLQSQINPHFLYNTLDNIMWLAEDEKKEDIEAIVSALSAFFRTTLAGGRDFITIDEEISHIEAYLKIQSYRYRDILSYEIFVPDDIRKHPIIKLTLQPIVENALYHGIKEKRGKGTVRVTSHLEEGMIVLVVSDDGIGMNEEELEELRAAADGKSHTEREYYGFGMANVGERLRLNYGEKYGLRINSVYGEGTTVEVRIPFDEV